ncbi:MAG TPA: hypothetical protein VFV50_04295 [Bdellovibrionales bacterium]|nr:hypothetical protein [Bdellovibrionales bacterium]
MSRETKRITRRDALTGLAAIGGTSAIMLGYQNCGSPTAFEAQSRGTGGPCNPDGGGFNSQPPVCESGGDILGGVQVRAPNPGDIHTLRVRLFDPEYFSHQTSALRRQTFITVDVGANPDAGGYHPTDYTNVRDIHAITDIFVIRRDTCDVIVWKRFSNGDQEPFGLMMIDPALVAARVELKVVAVCSRDGMFGINVPLGSYPVSNYAGVVGTFDPNRPFGSSTLKYPYIAASATGGQGNIGPLHAPALTRVSDDVVQVILGPPAASHGRFAENHYVNGAALFDQNGHLLSQPAIVRYSDSGTTAAGPLITFNNLRLAQRGVTQMRVVVFDTYNGYLMGFT